MKIRNRCRVQPQAGQGMTEYIIIVLLIAIAAILAFTYFGQGVREQTAGITTELSGQSAQQQITGAAKAAQAAAAEADKAKGLATYQSK